MLELMPPFYFLTLAKVSVSVSKKFGFKKSRYRSRKHLVSKKSLGLGLKNFGLKKSLGIGLNEIFWSRHSVSVRHAIGESRPFCQENFFFPKKRPKTAFFGGDESGVS